MTAPTVLESLRDGLRTALEDRHVMVLGEDVLDPYGGAFKVTAGLSSRFPAQVLGTPISEAAIVGVAAGLALRGHRPVVEIMFGDFLTLAMDQLLNHASKFRGVYADRVRVPLVVRTPMGGGRGYGATHSQTLDKHFLGVPGLRVLAPSLAHEPGDLLLQAIRTTEDPVLFLEHKQLYPLPLALEGARLVEEIPGAPTALVANHGPAEVPDLTVVAYGGASRTVLAWMARMKDEEIRVLAVFPSSLWPLPEVSIVRAVQASGRAVVVEEGPVGFGFGSEIAARLGRRLFGRLKAPIVQLAAASEVIPACADGEARVLVSESDLDEATMEVLA